ncbi:MAG: hypothetical protein N3G20_03750 [Verrucomicrobiae bacterium]|nr:hypothetical protein [Verrucomicrobiae bacterium]
MYVIAEEPILAGSLTASGKLALTLYGQPQRYYVIERRAGFGAARWGGDALVWSGGPATDLPEREPGGSLGFFRARVVEPWAMLYVRVESKDVVIEWLGRCDGCVLEETDRLTAGTRWIRCTVQVESEGNYYRARIPIGTGQRFYRLVQVK